LRLQPNRQVLCLIGLRSPRLPLARYRLVRLATSRLLSWRPRLTGGSVQSWIALTNTTEAACSVQGTADLTLLDAAGDPVSIAAWRRSPCRGAVPCHYYPVARLDPSAALVPHKASPGTAAFSLIWKASDMTTGKCDPPPSEVTGMRLTLPSGEGSVDVGASSETPVRLKPCGTWVSVGWIIASGELEQYLDYRLDAQIQEPSAVAAGQELSYTVSLSRSALGGQLPEFDPCQPAGGRVSGITR
jgi:hypothetical protein